MPSEPSFSRDISPLFRDADVEAMEWAFDLRSYESVRENAEHIYERVENGSMPCDEKWPAERVEVFRAWMSGLPARRVWRNKPVPPGRAGRREAASVAPWYERELLRAVCLDAERPCDEGYPSVDQFSERARANESEEASHESCGGAWPSRARCFAAAGCSGGPASTGASSVSPAPTATQPEPESAAPVESKLPGAEAYETCAAGGDYWPTMVVAATGSTIWVACKEESRLVPHDAATGAMGEEVALDAQPVAVVAGFDSLWALDTDGTLYRIDPDSGEIASRIDVAASAPYNLWTGAGSVWTIDDATGEVIRVSPETEKVVARVAVGDGPADMVFSGTSAWVANHRDLKLVHIDTRTNKARTLTTLRGTGAPERLALLGGSLWVTGRGTDLLKLNPSTGRVLQTVNLDVSGIDVVAADGALWVPTRSAEIDASGFPTASDLKRVTADGAVESVTPTEPFDVHGLVADETSLWIADTTEGVLYRLPLS